MSAEESVSRPSDAEAGVLAAVVLSAGDVLDELGLTGADFVEPSWGDLYDTARAMHANGKPVDQVTLADAVPAKAAFVWGLTDRFFSADTAGYYADIVKTAAIRRRVQAAAAGIAEAARDVDITVLADQVRTSLDAALGVVERPVRFMSETVLRTVDAMTEDVRQVPSPWAALNRSLGGLRPGALYVVGARPGVGKTVVGLQIAMRLAERGAVAFSSLEMPEQDLHLRAMAQGARVPLSNLVNGKQMPDWMWNKVAVWRAQAPLGNVAFDDTAGVSVFDVRTFARSVHRRRPLAGVVVDYLQLMTDRRDIPRHEKVADMSRQLKILARELDVPVVALSQLNRGSTSRPDQRPQLSDLRESGAIEQDADVVLLLDRDMEAKDDASDEMRLVIAKNRQGPTGLVRCRWEGEFVRITDRGNRPLTDQEELQMKDAS